MVELVSTLTCPNCGYQSAETIPTRASTAFHECRACHVVLTPKPGDCCVFCSYGTIRCGPAPTGRSFVARVHLQIQR